jgi:hypothetical protein
MDGVDHEVPSNALAAPDCETATQKVDDQQDKSLISPRARSPSDVHELPSKVRT